jgi:hypothetical protein
MVQKPRVSSPQHTTSRSRDRTISLPKWSRRMLIWSASDSVCSMRARVLQRARHGGASAKARRLASKCSSRSSRSASTAKRTWRNGLKDSNAVRFFSHTLVYLCSNFVIGIKNTRVRYTTRKQTTKPLMSRWRMPSQTGDRRNAHAGARLVPVCRDMLVTRNLGLVAMGRGISKIRARRRTTLTRRRREVGVAARGARIEVGGEEGIGWASRAV